MEANWTKSKSTDEEQANYQRERRNHPRVPCKGMAEFRVLPDGPKVVGIVGNLCLGGCMIECDTDVPAKAELATIELQLDVDDSRLRLAGRVRHIESNTQVGIQFIEVSSRKEEQIRALMTELAEAEKHRKETAQAERARS